MIEPLIRQLSIRDDLTEDDLALLRSLPVQSRPIGRGREMVAAHSWPGESCLLLEGVAGREMIRAGGGRQISALHFAGEFVDVHSIVLKQIDHSVVAMTDCRVAFIPHKELSRILTASPHLTRLFWLNTAIDGAIERAWIACMGRSSALEHLAHNFCEIFLRLRVIGLAEGQRFGFKLTQAELADCLGLSAVHINRSLQELRSRNLLDWDSQEIVIHNWDALVKLADFNGTYLNLIKLAR